MAAVPGGTENGVGPSAGNGAGLSTGNGIGLSTANGAGLSTANGIGLSHGNNGTGVSQGSGADLTIEQLAAAVGMTVRNIRNHRSRGLLPAPEVRGRVGYYGPEHVARLRLIRDLQADGFNLAAIRRLLDASSGSAGRVLGMRDAMMAPFESEIPDVVSAEEVIARYPEIEPEDIELLEKLKLIIPLGDGGFERPSPALVAAYERLTEHGIPSHATLALVGHLSRECDSIARRFVQLYMDELWKPFAEAGQPAERWDEVIATIGALRATASEALLAMFKLRMTAAVESASDRLLAEQAKGAPEATSSQT